jgi:hypothetical protein
MDEIRLNFLKEHCTKALLDEVFGDTDLSKLPPFTLDVNEILNSTKASELDVMKVMFVFEEANGILIFDGKEEISTAIYMKLGFEKFLKIDPFWGHNEINQVTPIFDLGEIEIPDVMPKFKPVKGDDELYHIEKLVKGHYEPYNTDVYSTLEAAERRISELKSTINYLD